MGSSVHAWRDLWVAHRRRGRHVLARHSSIADLRGRGRASSWSFGDSAAELPCTIGA